MEFYNDDYLPQFPTWFRLPDYVKAILEAEVDNTATILLGFTNEGIPVKIDSFEGGGGGSWGSITGVIADQTDLNTALDLKANLISPTLVTPTLGVATATSINGAAILSGTLNGTVTGNNTGDQDISGITTNASNIATNVTAISLNTAKVSYPGPQNAGEVVVNPAVNANIDVQAVLEDHEARIDGLAAGGSDGVVTNVALSTTDLNFTGTGGGFNGTVDLSSFATQASQGIQDTAISLNTAKVGITAQQASDIVTNNAKVSNIAHPLVETAVPIGAVFTDTIYDDTAIQAEVDLNTAKISYTDGAFIDQDVTSGSAPVLDATNFTNIPRGYVNSTSNGLVGAQDGVNLAFTVGQSSYIAGSLLVFVSGFPLSAGNGLTETTPASGIFTLDSAPESFDTIIVQYSN